jgi:hypothetical protein
MSRLMIDVGARLVVHLVAPPLVDSLNQKKENEY